MVAVSFIPIFSIGQKAEIQVFSLGNNFKRK